MPARIRSRVDLLAQRLVLCLVVLFICGLLTAEAGDWLGWRGDDGSGVTADAALPQSWGDEENVVWRVDLPDRGNSTPIIVGDAIVVTQAIEETNRRTVMVFDRADGKLRWQKGVTYSETETLHRDNTHCAASPASDGERIVAWFGSAGVYCYDLRGNELWHRELGKQNHMWGEAASPVFYKDLCILSFGPGDREFLIALNKRTGETAWEVAGLTDEQEAKLVEEGTDGEAGKPRKNEEGEVQPPPDRPDAQRGAWGTPLLLNVAGRDELIVSYPRRLAAYDPTNGKELWTCRGLGPLVYSSPIAGENAVVILGGYYGGSMAVRPGGNGDVTETHRLWHTPRSPKAWLCSGIIHNGHMYVVDMGGIAHCLDLESGEAVWSERLRGKNGNNACWSSLVRAGELLYSTNRSGDVFVFRAQPEFELVSTNAVNEPSDASLVPADGRFYYRTHQALWCLGQK